ncbi:uncharacterized protein LOC122505290 [Leptopilina heterotoma]|uniref:uncharacterized protein LOC122505290 n=1 Tax=Leptopilina heterotoma TaxID=63436 RepID=UPI001CA8728F|nr:uncharacterized protein LOC122505290 [Leptopilina heterotoma]
MFFRENKEKLSTLSTFVHSDGLIRLKTRILERDDSFGFLCPIVLDSSNQVVKLLIRETHENMGHAGVQTVMCQIREKFWILSSRKTVRSVIKKCVVCNRYNSKPLSVNPPPLPVHRVKDAAVFEVIGVDFAGPVYLRGQTKAWICLYTCAIYRAVHLELVTSLSTNNFLESLRRFIGRRGRPSIVYSDNGTNFVGAENAFEDLNWDVIANYSQARQIDWRFNPPTASWWGGWCERLIGMMKVILRKVLGKASLTFEEMYTVLCDCEFCPPKEKDT